MIVAAIIGSGILGAVVGHILATAWYDVLRDEWD